MPVSKKLTKSLEDYLEAIFEIGGESGAVHAKDIAAKLKVSRPSVTAALRTLTEKRLVRYEPYGPINLTAEGAALAQKVCNKHTVIKRFFSDVLLVEEKEADKVACEIEHILSERTFGRFAAFTEYARAHGIIFSGKKTARANE